MTAIGPRLNDPEYSKIVGEDHLGIRYVAINMSDSLQPGITSITPRARYWSFFAWVLFDFINMDFSVDKRFEKTISNFKSYLKQQECFFIYANIAVNEAHNYNIDGLQGVTHLLDIWRNSGDLVPFSANYLKASFGGYSAYRNVMKITGVTFPEDNENNIQLDRMTSIGRDLALAFEAEIRDTDYYLSYRINPQNVPKSVLLQYGLKAALSIPAQANDLSILHRIFLPTDPQNPGFIRMSSLHFYKYMFDTHPNSRKDDDFWREMFYDVNSPRGEKCEKIPNDYLTVAIGWEIFQARQYFTYSLEGIWSFMLSQLKKEPVSRASLIRKVLESCDFSFNSQTMAVADLIALMPISIDKRKKCLSAIRNNSDECIESALFLMFDVYSRFLDRPDFQPLHHEMLRMGGRRNISLQTWFDFLHCRENESIVDLLAYIIESYCINQHKRVALEKLMAAPNNQTFHFDEDDGVLHYLLSDSPTFNVIRSQQGVSIARDIQIIGAQR